MKQSAAVTAGINTDVLRHVVEFSEMSEIGETFSITGRHGMGPKPVIDHGKALAHELRRTGELVAYGGFVSPAQG